MFGNIKQILYNSEKFKELKKSVEKENVSIGGVNGSLLSFILDYLYENVNKKIVYISSDSEKLQKVNDDTNVISLTGSVSIYSGNKTIYGDESAKCFSLLSSSKEFVIFIDEKKINDKILSKELYSQSSVSLKKGEEYLFEELLLKLNEYGFEKKDFVEEVGDYAVRGGIVDLFPEHYDSPVRLEFFSETIESIREFDITTQRSLRELESVNIAINLLSENHEALLEKSSSILDYIPGDSIVVIDEPEKLSELTNIDEIKIKFTHITVNTFGTSVDINFASLPQPDFRSNLKLLEENISINKSFEYIISCSDEYQAKRMNKMLGDFEITELQKRVNVLNESLLGGFIFPDSHFAYFTEHQIFGRYFKQTRKQKKKFRGITFDELKELNIGDLIVHRDFGIGIYSGLKTIKVSGGTQEVIKLSYAEGDTMFLSLSYVNLISKYSATEGYTPKLTRIGGGDWDKIKERTKKKVLDIARDLILLYAKRKSDLGHSFAPDTHWQRELEANFIYEDTPDQARATDEVKQDMESENPMDRLVCGDVGFGKTEVAVRTAFKCVLDNKQAAILVPTTILAVQHYNTFRDRLSPFATEVECITRLKTKAEQNEILKKLEEGKIDILIGTHRLLSKDIKFKDLGLLIIDEEHRFGVKAKEKLRSLKPNVDTLTLTATPIPRTLNFSLLGARDLSVINTPPRNRKPIITEIITLDWKLVTEIIKKEFSRGGQIYFVNDKVNTIYKLADKIKSYIPEAKIGIAHGQMDGNELEDIIVDFIERKTNILVCTKIIESGLDIPNVNTIIINNANMYGLAELYQLRGRVGRSDAQAYAYFVSPPAGTLTNSAIRRLQAIEEYTELGSGFNLAMRDMEIRGVGNLLGKEQSGFVQQIGFEMFLSIIEETVAELKEKEFKELFKDDDTQKKINDSLKKKKEESGFIFENDFDAIISKEYVANDTERFNIYKRLYDVTNEEDLDNITKELRDRFGKCPPEAINLFEVIKLKIKAMHQGLEKITLAEDILNLYFPKDKEHRIFKSEFFNTLINKMSETKSRKFRITNNKEQLVIEALLDVNMESADHEEQRIKEINNILCL